MMEEKFNERLNILKRIENLYDEEDIVDSIEMELFKEAM